MSGGEVLRRFRARARARLGLGERGNAIVEFAFLSILFLVPLVYIMLGVFNVQRAMYATSAAARDAGRAYTLGANTADAEASARRAFNLAFQDQQLDPGTDGTLKMTCEGGCLQPGSVAVATVEAQIPLPFTGILGGYAPSINVSTVHRTPYGEYRQAGQ
ncbi:TadE/TadG family type IV pilus assembly protein [Flindersiella endophytica]